MTMMMTCPALSRADSPVWTKHTQDLFFHSADIDEHEAHVPNIVLVIGDVPVTILPSSLNQRHRSSTVWYLRQKKVIAVST